LNKPFRVAFYFFFKTSDEFDLQDNERTRNVNFNMKGYAPRLVLKQSRGKSNSEIAYSYQLRSQAYIFFLFFQSHKDDVKPREKSHRAFAAVSSFLYKDDDYISISVLK